MDLLALAKNVADRIEGEASRADVPITVCVIDRHGNIVLKHCMNGAPLFAIELSERKAYTAAVVGVRTIDLLPLVQPGQPLFALMAQGDYCAMGGGAPLTCEGQLIAGVGVSGGTVDQDVSILQAGLQDH
ncbi:MAG: heme-binding protein [Alphaproteobacteria bacterium]|nr:heme-binding protein [Alphaproteobacteria bacterium]